MSKLFEIVAAQTRMTLNTGQRAVINYTVINVSGRPIRGQFSINHKDPKDRPVENKWATIEGETARCFNPGNTCQYRVTVCPPVGTPPGKYTIRLHGANSTLPDEEEDTARAVDLQVLGAEEPETSNKPTPAISGTPQVFAQFPKKYRVHRALLVAVIIAVAGLIWLRSRNVSPNLVPGGNFAVVSAQLSAQPVNPGHCPAQIRFGGVITANAAGDVRYLFTRSDNVHGPEYFFHFTHSGSISVSTDWTLRGHYQGWQAIRILSPNQMQSNLAYFNVTCP